MVEFLGMRLVDVRTFEGEHFIPFAPGLTVLMGRNNAGKSAALRAPFLVLPRSRDDAPRGAYCRAGKEFGEVALRVKVAPTEFETRVGFPVARLNDVMLLVSGANRPLTNHQGFSGWSACPVVDLGFRFRADGSLAQRTLRCIAGEGRLDVLPGQDEATVSLPGVGALKVHVNQTWMDKAFTTFTLADASSPSLTGDLLAHWEHDRAKGVSDWVAQSSRRVVDTAEARLQETLVFLRMLHPTEYDHLNDALRRALPEFDGLDFIDNHQKGLDYTPGFKAKGARARTPLTRGSIGSGAWTYLCVLTAARAARATGARVLMLDEPHLYLHPELERLLIEELLDPRTWGEDGPLQIVAATHSPTFVDAAVKRGSLNIIDWKDETRTGATVQTVSTESAGTFERLTSRPSDLLYADRLAFVEGVSDVAALQMLARQRCGVRHPIRFVPLREADGVAPDIARYFSIIKQGHGLGFRSHGVLVLDGDKRKRLERDWDKLLGELDPRKTRDLQVLFVDGQDGAGGNDIESVFCNEPFLVKYFTTEHKVDEPRAREVVTAAIDRLAWPADHVDRKGCTAIRNLHVTLLGAESPALKKDLLEALMAFYIAHADTIVCDAPRANLSKLEDALRKLDA